MKKCPDEYIVPHVAPKTFKAEPNKSCNTFVGAPLSHKSIALAVCSMVRAPVTVVASDFL
jgi:hypothetical protein